MRPAAIAWLRRAAVGAGAVGAQARRAVRAGAAGLAAGLSIWRLERRRIVPVLMAAIVAGWVSTGNVTHRNDPPANGVTGRKAPGRGPVVAEAAPAPVSAPEAAAPPTRNQPSSADVRAPDGDVSNRRPHAHRRAFPAAAPAQRPLVTAYMDRQTYWAQEAGSTKAPSAPARSSRPFFSR
jgi:hypothetical protein